MIIYSENSGCCGSVWWAGKSLLGVHQAECSAGKEQQDFSGVSEVGYKRLGGEQG
jgi:hypothetical protein